MEHWRTMFERTSTPTGERGSFSFLMIVFALPVLFLLFTLTLDVGTYLARVEKDQRVLDDAALYAYKFLPDREMAEQMAREYLARHEDVVQGSTLAVSSNPSENAVTIELQNATELTFARLFGILTGAVAGSFTLPERIFSVARGTPFDVFIALDASGSLGPRFDMGQCIGSAWSDVEATVPSSFFTASDAVYCRTPSGGTVTVDPLLLTQQCFNERFSAVKRSAIRATEFFAGFGLNQIAVGVFPGLSPGGGAVDLVRELSPVPAPPAAARFLTYEGLVSATTWCGAIADHPPADVPAYRYETNAGTGVDRVVRSAVSGKMVPNPAFSPAVSDLLWMQPTREGMSGDIGDLLSTVRSQLLGAPVLGSRGGMSGLNTKVALIFLGGLPVLGGTRFASSSDAVATALTSQIQSLRREVEEGGKSFILNFLLVGSTPGSSEFGSFIERTRPPRDQRGRFDVRFYQQDDPRRMVQEIVASLVLVRRTAVISR